MSDTLMETRDVFRTFTVGAGVFSRKQMLTAVNGVSRRPGSRPSGRLGRKLIKGLPKSFGL